MNKTLKKVEPSKTKKNKTKMPLFNSRALLHLLVQMPAHLMVPSLTVVNEMDLSLGSERRQKKFWIFT